MDDLYRFANSKFQVMTIVFARLRFQSSWLKLSLYLTLTTLLLSLGFWQLYRAELKQQWLDQQQTRSHQQIQLSEINSNNINELRYQRLSISGVYDVSHQLLIDNQIREGKAGYLVLTPLKFAADRPAILVNRGWIVADPNRQRLPNVNIDTAQVTISGRLNHFPSVGIELAGADKLSDSWPTVVQVVKTEAVAKKLGYRLFALQIELDPQQAQGYRRDWLAPVILLPQQHRAYAVQWFALALTLTLLFFWNSLHKSADDDRATKKS